MLHDTPRGACSIEVAPAACSMLGMIQLLAFLLCGQSYSAANAITGHGSHNTCRAQACYRRMPMSNSINSLGCAIAQGTGLTETAAAAAACVPGPAGAAWLGRHAFAGPPGVTSGASSSPAALGSGALGSLMTGTAWHAAAADPTCACTHKPHNFNCYCMN